MLPFWINQSSATFTNDDDDDDDDDDDVMWWCDDANDVDDDDDDGKDEEDNDDLHQGLPSYFLLYQYYASCWYADMNNHIKGSLHYDPIKTFPW